jgi:signal peptidase II
VKSSTRIAVILFVIVFILALDQTTKFYAHAHLIDDPPRSYAGDTFRIQYATNTGAFLGLGNNLPAGTRFWLFNIFTSVVIAAIFVYVLAAKQMLFFETMAFALLVGGGIGNLIDRMFRGGIVVDFMNMGFGNLRTGIFNVADVAIMAGIFLLLTFKLFEREPKEQKEENAVERAEA